MGRKRFFAKCVIANAGYDQDWMPNMLSSRISSNGGTYNSKISNKTTHLVITPKQWKAQAPAVKEALKINRETRQGIHIVRFDWLDDCWNNEKKQSEGPYYWKSSQPLGSKSGKENGKAQQKPNADGDQVNGIEGAKGHIGMMTEAFNESTEKFLTEEEKKDMEKKIEAQRRVREEMAAEERKAKEEAVKQAAVFQKGAKKARNEIFSENHHIYTDETGFKYDVLLTKVDTRQNRNERWALTIYESNAEPHTFAMNAQFAGTDKISQNNVIAAIGCAFPTALHAFKSMFKEQTKVDWDKRISFALERSKEEKRNRGRGTGSEEGTRKGTPVSDTVVAAETRAAATQDFSKEPFQYHSPSYGPKGNLAEREKQILEEAVERAGLGNKQSTTAEQEKVKSWANKTNNAEPVESVQPEDPGTSIEAETYQDLNNDFDAFMANVVGAMDQVGYHNGSGNTDTSVKAGAMDQAGDYNNFDNTDTGIPGEIDFGLDNPFEFPFQNTDFGMENAATGQSTITYDNEPTQYTAINSVSAVPDLFLEGTQNIGETQIAEKALGELMEYIDGPLNEHHGGNGIFDQPELDLGSSILGKRKSSPNQEFEERTSKPKLDQVEGSVGEQSYPFDFADARRENDIPRLFEEVDNDSGVFVENGESEMANEQLQAELDAAEAFKTV